MKRYQLQRALWPTDPDGGVNLPTELTLRVMDQQDRRLNDAWLLLCREASNGRFGPFNAPELQLAWRQLFPEAERTPSLADLEWALRQLAAQDLIQAA